MQDTTRPQTLTNRLLNASEALPANSPLGVGALILRNTFNASARDDAAHGNAPRQQLASTRVPLPQNVEGINLGLLNIFNNQNNGRNQPDLLGGALENLQRRVDDLVESARDHLNNAGDWIEQKTKEFSNDVNSLIKGFSNENAGRFRYGFGSKTGSNGSIDCSGYMHMTVRHMTSGLVNAGTLDNATARMVNNMFATGAAYQFENITKHTNIVSERELLNGGLREGMVLGIDTGDRGWDRGRPLGIDHIAIVFRDEDTGRLMVSESTSRIGTRVTDAQAYVERYAARGNIYGADLNDVMKNCSPQLNAALSGPTPSGPTLTPM